MRKTPEVFKKMQIMGMVGALIGGCVGGYISLLKGSYIYAGIGVVAGYNITFLTGLIIGRRFSMEKLVPIGRIINVFVGSLNLLLALACLVAFFLTGEWIGIVGTILFSAGGIYMIKKKY